MSGDKRLAAQPADERDYRDQQTNRDDVPDMFPRPFCRRRRLRALHRLRAFLRTCEDARTAAERNENVVSENVLRNTGSFERVCTSSASNRRLIHPCSDWPEVFRDLAHGPGCLGAPRPVFDVVLIPSGYG